MKYIFFITTVILISIASYSQELPTEPANGFAFPIGSKFTIKLHPVDSTKFDYSVVKFEPFYDIIDTWNNETLFNENGEKGTIEFYFCLSASGETEEEKEKNMKVLLIMKNRTEYSLAYNSDIKTEENGEFKETSNVGIFPGAVVTEMWPYMILQIGLSNFKKSNN